MALSWTGAWGKTSKPSRFTKCGQEPIRLLATFGEVESVGTSMRKIEKLPLSNVAVFLAL
jgi:hypothetical protein